MGWPVVLLAGRGCGWLWPAVTMAKDFGGLATPKSYLWAGVPYHAAQYEGEFR